MQRRGAVALGRVDIRLVFDELQRTRAIVRLGGFDERPGRPDGRLYADRKERGRGEPYSRRRFTHQTSANFCVLSPTLSTGTPARSSMVRSALAIGVWSGYRRCWPPL